MRQFQCPCILTFLFISTFTIPTHAASVLVGTPAHSSHPSIPSKNWVPNGTVIDVYSKKEIDSTVTQLKKSIDYVNHRHEAFNKSIDVKIDGVSTTADVQLKSSERRVMDEVKSSIDLLTPRILQEASIRAIKHEISSDLKLENQELRAAVENANKNLAEMKAEIVELKKKIAPQ